jgi:AcrR family transcriptional regulator
VTAPTRKRQAASGASGSSRSNRGRGRPVDRDGRETRAAILTVAMRRFSSASYRDVSMEAIATECGLNVRALYHYFASKRELFVAARDEAFGRFAHEARTNVLVLDTARSRLDGYVALYRRLHANEPEIIRFVGMALVDGIANPGRDDSLSEAGLELLRLLEELVDDAIATGEVNERLDRDGILQLLSAISVGFALMSLDDTGPFPAMLDALEVLVTGTFFTGET